LLPLFQIFFNAKSTKPAGYQCTTDSQALDEKVVIGGFSAAVSDGIVYGATTGSDHGLSLAGNPDNEFYSGI
jgi:hypothetical protein